MNKKLCCFCVNDIHLITMLLPYINERINQDTKIITIFETDISKSAKKVINSVQGRKSEELLNISWKNTDLKYLYECDLKDKLIIVYGNNEFIKNANKIINNKKENCTILNCFEVIEKKSELQEILDNHDKIVNTAGEKEIEEVFSGYIANKHKKITL